MTFLSHRLITFPEQTDYIEERELLLLTLETWILTAFCNNNKNLIDFSRAVDYMTCLTLQGEKNCVLELQGPFFSIIKQPHQKRDSTSLVNKLVKYVLQYGMLHTVFVFKFTFNILNIKETYLGPFVHFWSFFSYFATILFIINNSVFSILFIIMRCDNVG